MPGVVKITVDTNILDTAPIARLRAAAAASGLDVDIRTVTVNKRALGSGLGDLGRGVPLAHSVAQASADEIGLCSSDASPYGPTGQSE